jgi:hypothetical protein
LSLFNSNPNSGKTAAYLALAMSAVFFGSGCFFLLTDIWYDKYPRPVRTYVGLVLIGWAIFRGLSTWLRLRQIKKEEKDFDY